MNDDTRRLEGAHCTIVIERRTPTLLVATFSGRDVDEFGDLPFQHLENLFPEEGAVELFIDARAVDGASIDVSGRWAQWLAASREQFSRIHMLTGSPFIRLTADFVRRFASLGELMHIYTAPSSFDDQLRESESL